MKENTHITYSPGHLPELEGVVKWNGREVHLTHQDKIYFAAEGITKGEVLAYYNRIYKTILPYLKDRPQSLRRNPNGIADQGFFQKDAPPETPSWVKTVLIHSEDRNKDIHYILCNDLATLFFIANLGCIEINPWFSRVQKPDKPDYLVIDLDPSAANTFEEVVDAALAVREVLDKAGASSYCKTSGATGLHIYVPLGARYTYDEVKDFSRLTAWKAQELVPEISSIERSLSKRGNKIYLDYLQNRKGQTLASPYSVRPYPGATVSAPLQWKEVRHGLHPAMFNLRNIGKRLENKGDLFLPVLGKGVDIRKCMKQLDPGLGGK